MSDARRPLPPFRTVSSADGSLHVTWPPQDGGTRAAVIVALRAVGDDLAAAFWAGELDDDLIRQPVDAARGRATLYVPSGRTLQLALVVRDANGEVVATPPVREAPVDDRDEARLERPVTHDAEAGHDTALVFARGGEPPGFHALTSRVAAQAAKRPPVEASSAPIVGFGARQRWTLTRLQWP
ncbi:MAG: hypothetical protein QF464_19835, partial [Myxococcota bacterium]|nr:hypothetical protein [Myxococcota bacterium]